MIRNLRWSALAALAPLLLAAGCGERMRSPETPETRMRPAAGRTPVGVSAPRRMAEPARRAPIVGVAYIGVSSAGSLGRYLVDSKGRALYMFIADEGSSGSTCYGACAQAWPPVLTSGKPNAIAGEVDRSKLGTITRKDGRLQATYAGWPLYYYVQDSSPNDTQGQDLMDYGAKWYLISPAGNRLEGQPMQAPETTAPETTVPQPIEPETIEPETNKPMRPTKPIEPGVPSPGGIY